MKKLLVGLGALFVVVAVFAFVVTRNGDLITPSGDGVVQIEDAEFEAFALPDYAAEFVAEGTKSYFVEVEPGIKIHVLETGSGLPIYMQHGNPTSGFLYRKVAQELSGANYRLVMPTMVGLGFSSKVPADQHTLENHMRWMMAALEKIGVSEAIYVGQDWGGPVGMGAMARSHGVLKGAVVMNTGFNAPKEQRDLSDAHAFVKTPVLGEAALEVFGSIFDRLPDAQGDPASMPADVLELYGRPVLESGNAKAPVALMRMVPDGPDHPSAQQMREIEAYVAGLDVPVEIVWGVEDPILGPALEGMKANFPNAAVTETSAGHFLQEEVPVQIAEAIARVASAIDSEESESDTAE